MTFLPYLGVGLFVGVISGLFGIGGGIVMVPAIIFLWSREPSTATATSLAVMIPGSIVASMRNHFYFGSVDWPLAAALAVGTVVGTWLLGVPLSNWMDPEALKRGFGILLIISGLKMAGVLDFIGTQANSLMNAVIG